MWHFHMVIVSKQYSFAIQLTLQTEEEKLPFLSLNQETLVSHLRRQFELLPYYPQNSLATSELEAPSKGIETE